MHELTGQEPADQALPQLVEAYGGKLYAVGLRFCGRPEEAQDLVQETFLRAFRSWHQFQGRSSPKTWLFAIAGRVCQRMHRKRAGEPKVIQSLQGGVTFDASHMAVVPDNWDEDRELHVQARASLERAIAELPVMFRMPLVLKELVGLSVAECAEVLGLREATVKTRLHRARLRLRNALEAHLPKAQVPAAVYSRKVCLDLLYAKQEALDKRVAFAFPSGVVCERCAEFFKTLDLTDGLCSTLADGKLPPALRAQLIQHVNHEMKET